MEMEARQMNRHYRRGALIKDIVSGVAVVYAAGVLLFILWVLI
jgi:hypothetical protein